MPRANVNVIFASSEAAPVRRPRPLSGRHTQTLDPVGIMTPIDY